MGWGGGDCGHDLRFPAYGFLLKVLPYCQTGGKTTTPRFPEGIEKGSSTGCFVHELASHGCASISSSYMEDLHREVYFEGLHRDLAQGSGVERSFI